MKKLILILSIALLTVAAYSQAGAVKTTTDQIEGVTVMKAVLPTTFSGKHLLTIQVLCTNVDGTSEGTLVLQGSVDGVSYNTLNNTLPYNTAFPNVEQNGQILAFPNDTLTVLDAAVCTWVVKDTPWKNYQLVSTGGAGDTTALTIKYVYK